MCGGRRRLGVFRGASPAGGRRDPERRAGARLGGGSGSKLSGSRFVLRTQESQGRPRAGHWSGLAGWQGLWTVECSGTRQGQECRGEAGVVAWGGERLVEQLDQVRGQEGRVWGLSMPCRGIGGEEVGSGSASCPGLGAGRWWSFLHEGPGGGSGSECAQSGECPK